MGAAFGVKLFVEEGVGSVAVEGPHYPAHPALSHPGWWRERRLWWAAAVILALLVVIGAIERIAPRPPVSSADQAASVEPASAQPAAPAQTPAAAPAPSPAPAPPAASLPVKAFDDADAKTAA